MHTIRLFNLESGAFDSLSVQLVLVKGDERLTLCISKALPPCFSCLQKSFFTLVLCLCINTLFSARLVH